MSISQGLVMVLILGQYLNYSMGINSGFLYYIVAKVGIISASTDFIDALFKKTPPRTKTDTITKGTIVFKDVSFKYDPLPLPHPNKLPADPELLFEDLNWYIAGGSNVCLQGQSGGGKSTLMKMLIGLYKPTSGSIEIDGVDIDEVSLSYLRKTVNYVNQETLLFDSSVLSNIGYGNAVSESEILSLIRRYGLDTVYSSLSGGVESGLCGKNGSSLSGGMQKVTMVLRGILKGGNILILDEPLAGLDKTTIVKMLKLITEENVGATKIIISHDNAIMPYMDKVIDITKL